MCGVDIEHLLHLFLYYNFAKDCWSVMGVQLDALQVEEALTWVLDRLATESMEVRVQLGKLLWGIWNARNLKVWEQKTLSPSLAMQWSSSQVLQWQLARKK